MLGVRTFSVDLDVRDEASIRDAVAAVEQDFGRVDILVNDAGCNIWKPAGMIGIRFWRQIYENLSSRHRSSRNVWCSVPMAASSTSGLVLPSQAMPAWHFTERRVVASSTLG